MLAPNHGSSQLPLTYMTFDSHKPVEGEDYFKMKTAMRRRSMGQKTIQSRGDWQKPCWLQKPWVSHGLLDAGHRACQILKDRVLPDPHDLPPCGLQR